MFHNSKENGLPAIGIEVYAELEPIDDELTRLQLLTKLERLHLGPEVFYSPPAF